MDDVFKSRKFINIDINCFMYKVVFNVTILLADKYGTYLLYKVCGIKFVAVDMLRGFFLSHPCCIHTEELN